MTERSPFARTPTIRGPHVVLRPMVASDATDMWRDVNDAEALRLTGTHRRFTRTDIERWCASRAEQHDRFDFAVVDATTGEWLGELVISDWDPHNRSCGFRISLSAHARGRGLGTEATRLVVNHLFEHLPVNRVSLEVYDFNPRARASYDKVGFVEEGVLREALWWEGEPHDAVVMGLLRRDWEDRRAADEAG